MMLKCKKYQCILVRERVVMIDIITFKESKMNKTKIIFDISYSMKESYYNVKESGLRIKKLRKNAGMTQIQLADRMGITVDAISQLERGKNGASVDTLGIMSQVLGATVDYIAFGRNVVAIPEDKMEIVMAIINIKS